MELAKISLPGRVSKLGFPLVFVGFAILAGLWPFHTWAPTGHVAAPTAASMLLAGVVMKLGAYGALRVAMTLFPDGLHTWQNTIALLAVIGIVYGATVALVQQDFKFVIGYSSVSHMGFVLLGLMTLTQIGLSGAVLQMFSHGIIAGLLFAVVGRMVYDRTHTRDLAELQPMNLSRVLPFAAVTFVIAGAASMGLPGFSGFIAELQVLVGAWQTFPVFAILAGVGILAGVAYTLRVLLKAFFAEGEVRHARFAALRTVSRSRTRRRVAAAGGRLCSSACARSVAEFDHAVAQFAAHASRCGKEACDEPLPGMPVRPDSRNHRGRDGAAGVAGGLGVVRRNLPARRAALAGAMTCAGLLAGDGLAGADAHIRRTSRCSPSAR